jgi:hypothetical protein
VPVLETVDDFLNGIVCENASTINHYLWEARRRPPILRDLFLRLAHVPRPNEQCRKAFHSAWVTQGLWLREEFSIDQLLPAALANLMPGYAGPTQQLFRGERWTNHENGTYGFSWTTSRDTAEMFARGLNCIAPSGGVLLATTAPPHAILAEPSEHSRGLGEDEYVLDRRRLEKIEAIERFFR